MNCGDKNDGCFPTNPDLNPFERQRWLLELSNSIERGRSSYDVATQLGISGSTMRRILKEQGVPIRSPFDNHEPLPLTDEGELQPPTVQPPAVQQIEPHVTEPHVTETHVTEGRSSYEETV